MVDDRCLMTKLRERAAAQRAAAASPNVGKLTKKSKRSAKDAVDPIKRSKKTSEQPQLLPINVGGEDACLKTPVIDLSKDDEGVTPASASPRISADHILTKSKGDCRQAVINLPKEGGMLLGPNSMMYVYLRFITRGDKAKLDATPLEKMEEGFGRAITDGMIYAFEAFEKYRKELSQALVSEGKALTKETETAGALEAQRKVNKALVTENNALLEQVKQVTAERDAEIVKAKLEAVEEFKKSEGFMAAACDHIKEHLGAFEATKFGSKYMSEVGAASYAFNMYTMQDTIYEQLKARDPQFKPAALGLPRKRVEPTEEHYSTEYEDSSDDEVTATETGAQEEQLADLQGDAETEMITEQVPVVEETPKDAQQPSTEVARTQALEGAQGENAQSTDEEAQVFGQLGDLI